MTVQTAITIGPNDHGRAMTLDDYLRAQGQEGYRYELIEGKVYVSPAPNMPHDNIEVMVYNALLDYWREHPEVINYVSSAPRVFVPGHRGRTNPESDIAAYHDFPYHIPREEGDWREISPLLVAEILAEDTEEKDLVRNVALYLQVPSIREYWIFDPRTVVGRPFLRVYRRRGRRWQRVSEHALGETYTTHVLPGFALLLDPDAAERAWSGN